MYFILFWNVNVQKFFDATGVTHRTENGYNFMVYIDGVCVAVHSCNFTVKQANTSFCHTIYALLPLYE